MGMVTNWLEPNGVVMSQGITVRKSALSTQVIDRHHRIGINDIFTADTAALQGGQQFAVVAHIGLRQHPLLVLERGQADRAVADPRPVRHQHKLRLKQRLDVQVLQFHLIAQRPDGEVEAPVADCRQKAESCASYIETRALGKVILN